MNRQDTFQIIKIAGGIIFLCWVIPQILRIVDLLQELVILNS